MTVLGAAPDNTFGRPGLLANASAPFDQVEIFVPLDGAAPDNGLLPGPVGGGISISANIARCNGVACFLANL